MDHTLIIALEEAKYKLCGMREQLEELGASLHVEELRAKAKELEELTYAENFWNDQAKSSKIAKELSDYKNTIESYDSLCARLEDAIVLAEMAIEENDEGSLADVEEELAYIENEEEKQRISVLPFT